MHKPKEKKGIKIVMTKQMKINEPTNAQGVRRRGKTEGKREGESAGMTQSVRPGHIFGKISVPRLRQDTKRSAIVYKWST